MLTASLPATDSGAAHALQWPAVESTSDEAPPHESEAHSPTRPVENVPEPASATVKVWAVPVEPRESEVKELGRLRVRGELFQIEVEIDSVHVTHPRWSLAGAGRTLSAAYLDLLEEARELAHVMGEFDVSTLDQNASELREFVLAFFGTSER